MSFLDEIANLPQRLAKFRAPTKDDIDAMFGRLAFDIERAIIAETNPRKLSGASVANWKS
jgi:hypothetical protein